MKSGMLVSRLAGTAALLAIVSTAAFSQNTAEADNGTDPTRLSRNFSVGLEYVDLPGGGSVTTANIRYGTPISADGRTALQFKLPVTGTTADAFSGVDIGDASVKLTRVLALTGRYGIVASGELSFDTAGRSSGGSGTEVLKLTLVYAKFLKGGAIFAPAIVHTERVGGSVTGRPDIRNTVIDFYYVPKLADKRTYMTIDPSIKYDWETDDPSAALAVTVGRIIDTGGPGTSSIFIKPSIGIGNNRGLDAGIEIGFKVVGF